MSGAMGWAMRRATRGEMSVVMHWVIRLWTRAGIRLEIRHEALRLILRQMYYGMSRLIRSTRAAKQPGLALCK